MNRLFPICVLLACWPSLTAASGEQFSQAQQPDTETWPIAPADSAVADSVVPVPVRVAAPTPMESLPENLIPLLSRWIPSGVLVGPHVGVGASRLRATTEYSRLVEPTAGEGAWKSLSWGGSLTVRWPSGFSLTTAPRRESFGLSTREETVAFSGNPFPHTLRSRTELSYNLYPLLAGLGWFTARHHVQAQAGAYVALLESSKLEWTVDGERYSQRPQVGFKEKITGWMLAAEYGYRLGKGELVVGIESHRAGRSAMDGLSGSIRPEAAQVRLSYLWALVNH